MSVNTQLTLPRPLSTDETDTLRDLLTQQLNISGGDDLDDAENLLDYAIDMIDSGEAVGHVTDEVSFIKFKRVVGLIEACVLDIRYDLYVLQ